MIVKEENRRDIEQRLSKLGDYVKIDYLSSCLKKPLDFDTRKFVLLKLAEIYEQKNMFSDAAKMIQIAANINTTAQSQINDFIKAGGLFIKAGNFDLADSMFEKAFAYGDTIQKVMVKNAKRGMYKKQAELYLKNDKRKNAMLAYERLFELDLSPLEKREVHEKLLKLYESLGKIREYFSLKRKS